MSIVQMHSPSVKRVYITYIINILQFDTAILTVFTLQNESFAAVMLSISSNGEMQDFIMSIGTVSNLISRS